MAAVRPTRYARERARCSGRQAAKQLHRNHCLTATDPLSRLIACLLHRSSYQSINPSINPSSSYLSIKRPVYICLSIEKKQQQRGAPSTIAQRQSAASSEHAHAPSLARCLALATTHPASQPASHGCCSFSSAHPTNPRARSARVRCHDSSSSVSSSVTATVLRRAARHASASHTGADAAAVTGRGAAAAGDGADPPRRSNQHRHSSVLAQRLDFP